MRPETHPAWDAFARATWAVTVTYADRFQLLQRVVYAALNNGVGGVVLVENGTAVASRIGVSRLRASNGERLQVVSLPENLGSAGGFRAGLQRVQACSRCEFIWLLDDDNEPHSDALLRLWHAYSALGADPANALLSLRRTRLEYLHAATRGAPVRTAPNSFLGFHLKDVPAKLGNRLASVRSDKGPVRFVLGTVDYAPYGGFFFHRTWLDKVGMPDERLYLYGDDHEFTSRFIRAGGRIFLCATSEVMDLDTSWHHKPVLSRPWVAPQRDDHRVYYAVRNRVHFERTFITSSPAYWINVSSYLCFIFLLSLLRDRSPRHLLRRARLVLRAIRAGWHGHLGRTDREDPLL